MNKKTQIDEAQKSAVTFELKRQSMRYTSEINCEVYLFFQEIDEVNSVKGE